MPLLGATSLMTFFNSMLQYKILQNGLKTKRLQCSTIAFFNLHYEACKYSLDMFDSKIGQWARSLPETMAEYTKSVKQVKWLLRRSVRP